jgi:hypothetical protein
MEWLSRKTQSPSDLCGFLVQNAALRLVEFDPHLRSLLHGRPVNTFQDNVTTALDTLTAGLRPFVLSQLRSVHGDKWISEARKSFNNDRSHTELDDDIEKWDAHALLSVMWDQWNSVFRRQLNLFERSLVAELRAFRNRWAHQGEFNFDDTCWIAFSGCCRKCMRPTSGSSVN